MVWHSLTNTGFPNQTSRTSIRLFGISARPPFHGGGIYRLSNFDLTAGSASLTQILLPLVSEEFLELSMTCGCQNVWSEGSSWSLLNEGDERELETIGCREFGVIGISSQHVSADLGRLQWPILDAEYQINFVPLDHQEVGNNMVTSSFNSILVQLSLIFPPSEKENAW